MAPPASNSLTPTSALTPSPTLLTTPIRSGVQICTPDLLLCSGNVIVRCSADGNHIRPIYDCSPQPCAYGRCAPLRETLTERATETPVFPTPTPFDAVATPTLPVVECPETICLFEDSAWFRLSGPGCGYSCYVARNIPGCYYYAARHCPYGCSNGECILPTATSTPAPTPTPTVTPTPTPLPTMTPTVNPIVSPSPTSTPSATPTGSPSPTPTPSPGISPSPTPNPQPVLIVTQVTDGDTVVLSDFSTVRLLGIDTPESDQFYYINAKTALEGLVLNKEVTLEADTETIDQYGRLLRYVYVDGLFVNQEMVSRGHAHVRIYSPNTRYAATLRAAQQTAKAAATNYWTPSAIACVSVSSFQYADSSDERFTLQNNCNTSVDLSNWVGYDEGNEQYRFPSFTLTNGSTVTVHTFSGTNNGVDLYWSRPSNRYVWNNNYDMLFLRDTSGLLVLSYSYGQ